MRKLRRLIPSGNTLFTFEAAARHESFTNAAAELNVTAAAVSHAIRQLEQMLELRLFERQHRKVRLTGEGAKLFHSVTVGLEHIYLTAEKLRRSRQETRLRLSVSIAIATYWLLPRLTKLKQMHPRVDISLYTDDQSLDLVADGLSLAISSGSRARWDGYDSWLFARERVYPVCSPTLRESVGCIKSAEDLLKLRLIHQDDRGHDGLTWIKWMSLFGVEPRSTENDIEYENYALVLRGAIDGQGVALGWHHLVQDLIERGELVRPLDVTVTSGIDFHVLARKGHMLESEAVAVRDWLVQEGNRMWPTETLDYKAREAV